jgi:hypothetical protein
MPARGTRARVKFFNVGRGIDESAILAALVLGEETAAACEDMVRVGGVEII